MASIPPFNGPIPLPLQRRLSDLEAAPDVQKANKIFSEIKRDFSIDLRAGTYKAGSKIVSFTASPLGENPVTPREIGRVAGEALAIIKQRGQEEKSPEALLYRRIMGEPFSFATPSQLYAQIKKILVALWRMIRHLPETVLLADLGKMVQTFKDDGILFEGKKTYVASPNAKWVPYQKKVQEVLDGIQEDIKTTINPLIAKYNSRPPPTREERARCLEEIESHTRRMMDKFVRAQILVYAVETLYELSWRNPKAEHITMDAMLTEEPSSFAVAEGMVRRARQALLRARESEIRYGSNL